MRDTSAPVRQNPIALEHGSELTVSWARGAAGYISLTRPNGDIALCLASDLGKPVLRVGEQVAGAWSVWSHVDAAADPVGPEGLGMAVSVTDSVLEVRLGERVAFSIVRPETLSGPLNLRWHGAFTGPRLGVNAEREAALGQMLLPQLQDHGLGERYQENLIYDIGLHVGQDTDFYLKKGFRVVAVEANPVLATLTAHRFAAAIAAGRLTIVNVGLGRFRGSFPFYVNRVHSEWSSFDRAVASRGHPVDEVTVPTNTIGAMLKSFGVPYYMKIDIEAYDRFVIEGLEGAAVLPHYLSIENGPLSQFEMIVRLGYRRFKLIEQSRLEKTMAMLPAREGRAAEHCFPHGSSGPFGEEAAGDWLNTAAMRDALSAHHAGDIPDGEWYDLHAALP